MIILNIDLTKIDKNRIREVTLNNGHKAKYYDIVVNERRQPDDRGNTHLACEGVSREERASGVKGTILGSGKEYGRSTTSGQHRPPPAMQKVDSGFDQPEDDIPF